MEQGFNPAALLMPPDITKCKRILCVQPHPDDNEIGMGGTIAVLAKAGCEVHYLTVTKGDQGNLDKNATPEETAAIRRKEAEAAGGYLGAKFFHFLDYGDGTLNDPLGLSHKIARVIQEVRPDAVFGPDPWLMYESHLDHIVTGQAVSSAVNISGRNLGFGLEPVADIAIGYYFTANPNTVIDITGSFEQKFEAIALHKSQIDATTYAMFKIYFEMKGRELAQGRGFELGEGLKVLGKIHTHCFVDAYKI